MSHTPDLDDAAGIRWASVMARFNYRCACSGQCGAAHRAYRGRCGRRHVDGGTRAQQPARRPDRRRRLRDPPARRCSP
ncbi:hypothetical protein ACU686_44745 [Yinghuangia aomiensis]